MDPNPPVSKTRKRLPYKYEGRRLSFSLAEDQVDIIVPNTRSEEAASTSTHFVNYHSLQPNCEYILNW